uniref:Uncharacterized protein n=1 Tax=Cyanothece sp. (strain PCC 7425 / ATCC 29141) TaxID=395961 RepID=B8HMC1_CYAP4
MPPRNLKKDCQTAIKLLERLAEKFNRELSPERIAALNLKRDNQTITSDDLPAVLRKEFPGQFTGMNLRDIREIERNSQQGL